ncbi:hypothetical protein [Pantoea sp. S18]|uniref:hypothetical protein n=1 Tax=Pantoea sp. S18 TaxID=3019892 RepID=UPI002B21458B|nr:hypothetical protein [Pantoea sp. S18]MEA5101473.1 hypothetical protein [Pantoea sp. S18]
MKNLLLNYIDCHLNTANSEHMERLVYFIAKLSLISPPVAWIVKLPGEVQDKLFLSHADAFSYMELMEQPVNYIMPLYAAVNVEVVTSGNNYAIAANIPNKEK